MMKILVVSQELWHEENNSGNYLSNIFEGFDAEFANICCSSGIPKNKICKRYFQITDGMVLKCFFGHRKIGKELEYRDYSDDKGCSITVDGEGSLYQKIKRGHSQFAYICRNILWFLSNWKHDDLKRFIINFNPDIIYAPCYGNPFMCKLTKYIADLTGKNVISFVSDDFSLHQFSLSPFFWINRLTNKYAIKKVAPYYSFVFTATKLQKEQCEKAFGWKMDYLYKVESFPKNSPIKAVGNPINLIYAGGTYLNRWKILLKIRDAILEINNSSPKMHLDIYSSGKLKDSILEKLNDSTNSTFHDSVPKEALEKAYRNSDIALHVESFDLKNRLITRMSFSTKIVDCLSSGCAVMAICDKNQGGYQYLKDNDAAICVNSIDDIYPTLRDIVNNTAILLEYAKKAKDCAQRNHDKEKIQQMVLDVFKAYMN